MSQYSYLDVGWLAAGPVLFSASYAPTLSVSAWSSVLSARRLRLCTSFAPTLPRWALSRDGGEYGCAPDPQGATERRTGHGFLVGRLRRSWGVAAVRAAAYLRVSRLSFVGMPTRVVQGLRRAARTPYRGHVHPRVFGVGLRPDVGAWRFGRG